VGPPVHFALECVRRDLQGVFEILRELGITVAPLVNAPRINAEEFWVAEALRIQVASGDSGRRGTGCPAALLAQYPQGGFGICS
jgi:hypothetical protein